MFDTAGNSDAVTVACPYNSDRSLNSQNFQRNMIILNLVKSDPQPVSFSVNENSS